MGKKITMEMIMESRKNIAKMNEQVQRHEGFRKHPYKCPAGKLTIGYGFNIEDEGVPEEVAEFWLNYLLGELEQELGRAWPFLQSSDMGYVRIYALLNMSYNLGVPRLLTFKKMFAAIEVDDWDTASKEALDSEWAKQVGNRAIELAKQMETGEWQE